MKSPAEILKQYWGYETFRPLQEAIINSVLQGNDTLALLPTGGGKSICYQVPALAQDGFCLVVSPLIALMQDQVARLQQQEIQAACLHAGMNRFEVEKTLKNMLYGPYKLLYVSPERLQTELFLEFLPEFNISLIAVDEAHCISQWGHDFRPDYLKIATVRKIFREVPLLALTASATNEVREDICKQLQFSQPRIFSQSFERKNIFFEVRYSENKPGDTVNNINATDTSIIYCRSRKQTELVARQLQRSGIAAIHYHAGMAKDKREAAQLSWMQDEHKVMTATTAFGMGIDKPDVRLVLHYDAPEHLEAYYQEAGRAGRDGKKARALLLYNSTDINRLRNSIDVQFPPETYLRQVYQSVAEYLQIPIGNQPDTYFTFDLGDFCKKFRLEALPASHALRLLAQEGLWTLTDSVFHPASIQFTADRYALDNIINHYPILGIVITTLLRLHSTIFYYPTVIRVNAVARQVKMTVAELETTLEQLQKMEVLEYNKPKEGPQLFFHHLRVDSRHLLLNIKRIRTLREKHIARTDAMIAFLQNTTECRERMVLAYFGETSLKDCGHCDVCISNKDGIANNDILYKALYAAIEKTGSIEMTELIKQHPASSPRHITTLIRNMVDEGLLSWEQQGTLSLNK